MQLDRYDLGSAAGTKDVGVARLKLDPGGRSSPVHVELDEEEIFYVLAGSGLSWQDGKTYEVRAGDCIVHRVAWEEHTLIAGQTASTSSRSASGRTRRPRTSRARRRPHGVTVEVRRGRTPGTARQPPGELELPEPSPRPSNIVNRDELRARTAARSSISRAPQARSGPASTGSRCLRARRALRPLPLTRGGIFVVLDGSGVLELWPTPGAYRLDPEVEKRCIHCGRAMSSRGLRRRGSPITSARRTTFTFLAYGTRKANDICYYPPRTDQLPRCRHHRAPREPRLLRRRA